LLQEQVQLELGGVRRGDCPLNWVFQSVQDPGRRRRGEPSPASDGLRGDVQAHSGLAERTERHLEHLLELAGRQPAFEAR